MQIKDPIIKEKSSFNFITSIWLVPFIALIVGGWLIYEHFSKLGPLIKIEFSNSSGLVAGQSVVKFRDVSIGKVTKIEINANKEGVVVYARVNKDAQPFLNESTKFWIVKPEVGYSGVKGLDTLLSGTYINMVAKKGKKEILEYVGLDSEYIEIGEDTYYALECSFPMSVKKGTPLYYKGKQVGVVAALDLDPYSKNVVLMVKIYKKYNTLVNSSTKFWIQSLVDLKLNNNRIEFNIAPLPTLVMSGISFETYFDKKYDSGVSKVFKLYRSVADAKNVRVGLSDPLLMSFVFEFEGDVSSIDPDADIMYKGFKVGELKKLKITYNKVLRNFEAKCLGEIDFANFSTTKKDGFNNFKELAKRGIVAKLEKSNLLLNRASIILSEDNTTEFKWQKDKEYNSYIFPTKDLQKSDLLATLSAIAKKLQALNLDKTVDSVNAILDKSKAPIAKLDSVLDNTNKLILSSNKTIKSIEKIVSSKDFKNISANVNKSLVEFKKTLNSTKRLLNNYGSNSLFADKLDATIKELHNTTQQTNRLLHKLNKKPNSLIFGD
jgi:paraquat-inducible protein B